MSWAHASCSCKLLPKEHKTHLHIRPNTTDSNLLWHHVGSITSSQCLRWGCYKKLPGAEGCMESRISFLVLHQVSLHGQPLQKGHSSKHQVWPLHKEPINRAERPWHGGSDEVRAWGEKPLLSVQTRETQSDKSFHSWCTRDTNWSWATRDEHQTWQRTENTNSCVYKNSAKRWKNYKTHQGRNLSFLWHFSVKDLIYYHPWYSLLHNNFIIACPITHRARESADELLPQIREFITKIMDYFYARGHPGYSWEVNFVLSGPKASSVTYPVHVYTESGQKDTYRLENQREQSWLIKTKEVITVAQIIHNAIRQANIPNCISIK